MEEGLAAGGGPACSAALAASFAADGTDISLPEPEPEPERNSQPDLGTDISNHPVPFLLDLWNATVRDTTHALKGGLFSCARLEPP